MKRRKDKQTGERRQRGGLAATITRILAARAALADLRAEEAAAKPDGPGSGGAEPGRAEEQQVEWALRLMS